MTPADQYKIWEIITDHGCRVARTKICTKADADRFTHSVNHPDVLGDDARHARTSKKQPKQPMSAGQCRAFIEQCVRLWLVELATIEGIPTEVGGQ